MHCNVNVHHSLSSVWPYRLAGFTFSFLMLIPFNFLVSHIEENLPTDGSTVWSTQAAPLPRIIAVVFIHHQVLEKLLAWRQLYSLEVMQQLLTETN